MTPATPISVDPTPPAGRNAGGAPRLNSNATRSGRYGLILGRLPSGCSYIRQSCAIFRRGLEQAVLAARGSVSLSDALAIRTATRWERHALLCGRWLHGESTSLTPEQRLALSRDIANASERSDRAVKSLALPDRKSMTVWDAIHRRLPDATSVPVATPEVSAQPEPDTDPQPDGGMEVHSAQPP